MLIVAVHRSAICVYLQYFREKVVQVVEWMWPNRPRFAAIHRPFFFRSFTKIDSCWPQWIAGIQFGFVVGPFELGKHLNLIRVYSVGNIFNLVYLDYKQHYMYLWSSFTTCGPQNSKLISRSLVFWLTEKFNKYKEIIWVSDIFIYSMLWHSLSFTLSLNELSNTNYEFNGGWNWTMQRIIQWSWLKNSLLCN